MADRVRRFETGFAGVSRRVAIVQPAVPEYRVPFFTRLIAAGKNSGIHVDVFAGETPTETRARGDSSDAAFIHPLRTRELRVRGRTLLYKSPAPILAASYDLLVLELAVRNVETYELLVRHRGRRLAFWGHGRTYTKDVSPQQEFLKYWLVRRADWFFGYTERGVDAVVDRGFPRTRTSVLNNTIDIAALGDDLSRVSDSDVRDFYRRHDLRGSTVLYLGGLDADKRIRFLLRSAQRAHDLNSDFRILIAGNGSDRPLVEDFVAHNGWAIYLGALQGPEKARALAVADALCIPGRIGLVAVDSMVAGTPIVGTNFRYHAPEREYLEDGVTAVFTAETEDAYATGIVDLLSDRRRLKVMSDRCHAESQAYTLDLMVFKFLEGIISALR